MACFFRGFNFVRHFYTPSVHPATLGVWKEQKIYPSLFPHLRPPQTACTKALSAKGRSSHRDRMLVVVGLLVSMTMVAPGNADSFYTAPRYDGWVLASLDFKGAFGDPESALREYWNPNCFQRAAISMTTEKSV
jgi:hypothetical protein